MLREKYQSALDLGTKLGFSNLLRKLKGMKE